MKNLMKAGLMALVIGGIGLAGLAPAEAATFVAGGPGAHVAVQTGPSFRDGHDNGYHRGFTPHHRRVICVREWRHHHPVRICRTVWR